ncbi:MAG: right-handed parallel beta-helix repeat-containing protein, partial [Streptosporangiales bacterium]|nr:right-handed parallel beta-helix repeat-containing protein [Streptosporangiales bacterium]
MAWRRRRRDRGADASAEEGSAGQDADGPDALPRVCPGCGHDGAADPMTCPIGCPRCGTVSRVAQQDVDRKLGVTVACSNADCGQVITVPASVWCPECGLNLRHPAVISALVEQANRTAGVSELPAAATPTAASGEEEAADVAAAPPRVCPGCGHEGAADPVTCPVECPRCGTVSRVPQRDVDKKVGTTVPCSNADCGLVIDVPASVWCPDCELNLRTPAVIAELVERANPAADLAEDTADVADAPAVEAPAVEAPAVDAPADGAAADTPDEQDADAGRGPRTHVVDGRREDAYASIGEAVRAAAPGDRIVVRPGLYRENVVVDRPLELVGDGPSGDVVVESSGAPAVEFEAESGRVANLTLRGSGGGPSFGVDIKKGRLELEGCDISSTGMSGVIIDYGADPRLRGNRIHDARQAGVVVTGDALGVIEDNEICRNGHAGVAISKGANPTLRRNRIHSGGSSGVQVYERGRGLLEDNEIAANSLAGVDIDSGANPTLRGNRIRDGKQSGVYVHGQGLGVLEDNDVTANAYVGVAVSTGGSPTVRGNRLGDNQESGFHVYDNGLGVYEDNEITGSGLNGVTVRTGGSPVMRGNHVRDSKVCGVYVYDNGLGVFEDNRISGSAGNGVRVKTGGSPVVRGNTIGTSGQCGVWVSDGGL